jgi:hypothetical protein
MIPAIIACKLNRDANGHEGTSSIAEQMPIKNDSEARGLSGRVPSPRF